MVLAAGRATRFGRLKQLEPVGPTGAALFVYSIFDAVKAGFSRVALVVPPGLEQRFDDQVGRYCTDLVAVDIVPQDMNAIPRPSVRLGHRVKPWGTAHALLVAAEGLGFAFAVINADDFYGLDAYRQLHGHLLREPAMAALVGYKLTTTLSPFGGVSRGLCEVDGNGMLTGLTELRDVRQHGGAIVGTDVGGRAIHLRGQETVSMNLWGLNATVVSALHGQFSEFLSNRGSNPDTEFLLSSAIDQQVRSQTARLRVLNTNEQWCGMTFPDDTTHVRQRIAALVARGLYPHDLSKGRS